MRGVNLTVRIGWLCLAAVSLGILVFGMVVALFPPDGDAGLYRADGLASAGLGLFGMVIVLVPYRRRERWAWYALWFYPVFWMLHLAGNLPPGNDHIHQVVFIALSLIGLLLPVRAFFPLRSTR
ncbi:MULTISPECIES: hypothetical protein [Micrococcaceae]|uniref:Uncharacterized protein n=1 Tax=Arthrobacter sedimenti TaxID=2694931 RepID=A0ABV8WEM1_9MICC|nr:hypothetical protein [Pseudarthrobacter defluvii]WJH23617.1 hypothetical protein JCQ34_14315 [Pseudarthrobacter defluvii]